MANYTIEFLRTAQKQLAKLPLEVQQRIANKIDELNIDPYPPGIKALKNGGGRLRLRVGNYRIIYLVETNILTILIISVGHRKNIYR